jgi:hypothetical protein
VLQPVAVSPAELRPYLVVLALIAGLIGMRRVAGRLAPKVAIAPLIFLVTRRPVMFVWILGSAGWLALLVPAAIAKGNDGLKDIAIMSGISLMCGLGMAALIIGPIFMGMRAFAVPPVLPLEPGEKLVREMTANHFLDGEARGGKLLLTDRRLGFKPHRFNVQLSTWSVRLPEIRGVAIEGDRFLVVDAMEGRQPEWIVVMNPQQVAKDISAVTEAG